MMSVGWQFRVAQIDSKADIGISFIVPRVIADMVAGRKPVISAKRFWVMLLIAN